MAQGRLVDDSTAGIATLEQLIEPGEVRLISGREATLQAAA